MTLKRRVDRLQAKSSTTADWPEVVYYGWIGEPPFVAFVPGLDGTLARDRDEPEAAFRSRAEATSDSIRQRHFEDGQTLNDHDPVGTLLDRVAKEGRTILGARGKSA